MNKNELSFISAVHEKIVYAFKRFDITEVKADDVEIKLDMKGTSAGQARVDYNKGIAKYTVRFNPEALDKYYEELVENTVPHEIAHIVCYIRPALGKNHNKGFKLVATILGDKYKGKRTHKMQLSSKRKKSQYVYNVNGNEVYLGATRHNRLISGKAEYNHASFGKILPSMFVRKVRL